MFNVIYDAQLSGSKTIKYICKHTSLQPSSLERREWGTSESVSPTTKFKRRFRRVRLRNLPRPNAMLHAFCEI
jgi:hypothetical protein